MEKINQVLPPERKKALEDWIIWESQYLGRPKDSKKAKSAFLEIRDGQNPITAPVLTREQVLDLCDGKVVDVQLPTGTIVQDLSLRSPECFKIVLHPTSISLFDKTTYEREAGSSPFVKSCNSSFNSSMELPLLRVPFRISE